MSGHGATHTARSDINSIRNTLLEGQAQKTSLMYILKEIVQNADDCKASQLGIGWSSGLLKANHPLLRGPGIVAVNNGPFSRRDAKSIRSIGLSAKENDSSAVGKFGLGLKTVFLLCEAFFYLVGPKAEAGIEPGWILNLWYTNNDEDDVPVSEWDRLGFSDSDQSLIASERKNLGLSDGFTLWIPLRCRDHCQRGGYTAPIIENYPGELEGQKDLRSQFHDSLSRDLASLMPLLKHIRRIEMNDGNGLRKISVSSDSQQCFESLTNVDCKLPAPLAGTIDNISESVEQYKYFGYQNLLASINSLKEDESWPKNIPLAGPPEKQKAEPHCAVTISAFPVNQRRGQLLIRWAVFLPTAETPSGEVFEPIDLPECCQEDYTITLHGFFFLQSDRRRIRNWHDPQSKDHILSQWNRDLAEQGTLRLLLPALEAFAQQRSSEVVRAFVEALQDTSLWKAKQHICADGIWVYGIQYSHSEQPSWHFVRDTSNLLEISESIASSLPNIFPNLTEVCGERVVVLKEWPKLTPERFRFEPWQANDVAKLVKAAIDEAGNICADSQRVKGLTGFLNSAIREGTPGTEQVNNQLYNFLHTAFKSPEFKPADNLDQLVDKISAILPLPKDLPTPIEQQLLNLAVGCLIVPSSVRISKKEFQESLSIQASNDILKVLESTIENAAVQGLVKKILIPLLHDLDQANSGESEEIKSLRLIPIILVDCADDSTKPSPEFRSLNDIAKLCNEHRLFTGDSCESLLQAFATALRQPVYTIETSWSSKVGVQICTQDSVLNILCQSPPLELASPDRRHKLLREFPAQATNPRDYKVALRYLLHAEVAHHNDIDVLLYGAIGQQEETVWSKVLHHLVEAAEQWRFIDVSLLKALSQVQCEMLNIHGVDDKGVTKELKHIAGKQSGLAALDWQGFSREERETLIYRLPLTLVSQLKLHEPANGVDNSSLVGLDSTTYLQGKESDEDLSIPPELARQLGIVLLRRSDRPEVALRQSELSPPINAASWIGYLLGSGEPVLYWAEILDAIQHSPLDCTELEALHSTPWLPAESGQAYAPNAVIDLQEMQGEIQRITAECDGMYLAMPDLRDEVKRHQAFSILQDRLLPSRTKALEMLGEMLLLLENGRYCLGRLSETFKRDDQAWSKWIEAFQGLDLVMPAINILANLHSKDEALTLLEKLAEPLETERLIEVLNALAHKHSQCQSGSQQSSLFQAYRLYLDLAFRSPDWNLVLSIVQLLSEAQEWRSACELCYGASDIDTRDVLQGDLAILIKDGIHLASSDTISVDGVKPLQGDTEPQQQFSQQDVERTCEILQHYFKSWPRQTNNTVALLLRVVGGHRDSRLQQLANQYFSSIDYCLEDLELDENVESLRNDIDMTVFVADEHHESTKQVTSLIGTPLHARLLDESNAESLIVGGIPRPCQIEGTSYIRVSLRKIISLDDEFLLNRLAKQSFKQIVEEVYRYKITNLDTFWDELQTTAPPDIRQAQNTLLNDAIISLRSQLRLDRDSAAKQLIRERFELQKQREELRTLQEKHADRKPTYQRKLTENNRLSQDNKEQLRKLVIENKETQDAFLAGVRQRIKNASYDKLSIPFELFQNADDACWELRDMGDPNVSRLFSVTLGNNKLLFSHWGRSINQSAFGGDDRWKEKGYDDDLLKMLLLNFSDKSAGVTGKFGLGFKTVFLLSAAPRAISDRIGFEVIGGIYPRQLTDSEFKEMQGQLEGEKTGTLIQLNVREADAKTVIQYFARCVPLLGAFSRWLKEFRIRVQDEKYYWKWSEAPIPNTANVYYCRSTETRSSHKLQFIALGKPERRCLLQLSPRGLEPLSSEYPTFWVTAPTRMKLEVGLAINAHFHPDVGRSQLDLHGGGKEHNQTLAREIGTEFGQALASLVELDDSKLCQALNLAPDTTRLMFWSSVWSILGEDLAQHATSTKGIALLRDMFWSEGCGLALLYKNYDALPTGLPTSTGELSRLTRISAIRWQLQGVLAPKGDQSDSAILKQVLKWPIFQDKHHIEPGQLVSSQIANALKTLMGHSVDSLNLLKAMEWQIGSSMRVTPDTASIISPVLTKDCFDTLKSSEQKELQDFLKTLEFQAADEQWYPARQLLVQEVESDQHESSDKDELRLAKFAPDSALLSDDYYICDGHGFFYVCRQSLTLNLETRGNWILRSSSKKRPYCIQYLLNGKHRDDLIEWLKPRLADTWLFELKVSETRRYWLEQYGFVSYLFDAMLYVLGLLDCQNSSGDNPDGDDTSSKQPDPKSILHEILEWWKQNRESLVPQYKKSLYPNDEILTESNYEGDDPTTAKRWLTLFSLGALQTMGRSKPEQHRNFLEYCDNWGWFDVMVSREVNQTEWTNLLANYFAMPRALDNLEYYQWVRYYPAFYALSRWWPQYRDSLLSANANKQSTQLSFPSLFNPNLNQALQGTGWGDAPPAGSLLGIGAIFVVRELMRSGILTNPGMRPYAYVPARRVHAHLCSIGCKKVQRGNSEKAIDNSRHIYDFLVKNLGEEDATFCGDYDLPFLMLQQDTEL